MSLVLVYLVGADFWDEILLRSGLMKGSILDK